MVTKIKFCWNVLRGKYGSWVFFNLTDEQQLQVIRQEEEVDLELHCIGVDKRVMEILVKKLSK